ncbi:response regulator [Simiduia aestuariiviva]|uniref:DNA-binding NarL/FixJ family response regulator n=1 Tax=Simiduia aestuariiviva TaxID=1510459 RepID=A0A839UPL5_9GAMM|nr:response regulator [Simiduia aestuariiviva]MBB3168460.1 DNA-binding NarL/FixJ family response regulator [Simiduia aestuariiviva]
MIKILVVDDHDLVRTGIVRMLSDVEGIEVIGEADSGETAITRTKELSPHVILMDVKMPGMGGLEATKKLLHWHPEVRIVAVTACDDDLYPQRLLQAGASGYITKGADLKEMIEAVHTVVRGDIYMSNNIARQLAMKNFGGRKGEQSPFELLSERELQTALMIANGQKPTDIAATFNVSPKTVNTYRYRIFEKLNIGSDVELTLMAVKHHVLDPESVV